MNDGYRLTANGYRLVRFAAYVLLAMGTLACNEKGADFFLPGATSPQTGNLTGVVASGAAPISAATVSLSQSLSTTTNSSGVYNFLDLSVGQFTVTTTATGFTCVTQTVTILLNQTVTSNITCTPLPGSVTGTVRVSGTGQSGVAVTLTQGTTTIGSTTTASGGTYTFANIPPGAYSASVTPPANTTCTSNPQNVTVVTNQAATANFDCTPILGSVTGAVRVSGVGQSGVLVLLSQGATNIGQAATGADGTYTIANVAPGTYSAAIAPPANTTCANNPQSVTVNANQASTANFDCSPLAGAIIGTVRFDGVGQGGRVVVVSQGISTAGTATTAADGTYRVSALAPGTYSVSVTPPVGGSCSPNPQTITVQANQDAAANFDCTTPQDFAVTFGDPSPSYRHIVAGVSGETCVGISTTPAQPGAQWTTTWTGSGTVGSTSRTGTFDASNHVIDRQPINDASATYNLHVSVVSGTTTRTADASVVVTSAAGTCPP